MSLRRSLLTLASRVGFGVVPLEGATGLMDMDSGSDDAGLSFFAGTDKSSKGPGSRGVLILTTVGEASLFRVPIR